MTQPQADISYSYADCPTLERFSNDWKRTVGVMGPFGSGKSTACVMKLIEAAQNQPPMGDGIRRARYAVIRNTYRQLEDTTMRTLFDWLPPDLFGTYIKSEHRYIVDKLEPDLEIEFVFRALDRPEHISNLLSAEYTGAWVNEAREVPWEIIRVLGRRVGRYPKRDDGGCWWYGIILDTNPPDSDSDWYGFFEERKPASASMYKQPGGLSPLAENLTHLTPDYYSSMADDMTDEELKVYRDGEYGFITSGKPVYAEYSDSVHCREFKLSTQTIIRGWDFGLTPACVFVYVDPFGRLRAIDELYSPRAGIQRFGAAVIKYTSERFPENTHFIDVGDPAGDTPGETNEESCFDMMRTLGLDPELPNYANQSPLVRQESVRQYLSQLIDGEPGLLVHPRCKMLRKGFQGAYQYRRVMVSSVGARFDEKPLKNEYSHPHDALQYACTYLVGDLVRGMLEANKHQTQTRAVDQEPFDKYAEPEYARDHYDPFGRTGLPPIEFDTQEYAE